MPSPSWRKAPTMSDSIPAPPPCSVCEGRWLHGLTHQHRTDCPRYHHETATLAADYQRVSGIRETTTTEREIIDEHRYAEPGDGDRFLIQFVHSGGWASRTVLHGTGPTDNERAPRAAEA